MACFPYVLKTNSQSRSLDIRSAAKEIKEPLFARSEAFPIKMHRYLLFDFLPSSSRELTEEHHMFNAFLSVTKNT
jgi:hypothetical protein